MPAGSVTDTDRRLWKKNCASSAKVRRGALDLPREPAAAQPFLHAGEHRLAVACLDMDDPVGEKIGLLESRREQIRMHDAPEHLSGQAI